MPKLGVRSVVTYALTGAVIAATFIGTAPENRATLDNAFMLALGFFFKAVADAVSRPPSGGSSA